MTEFKAASNGIFSIFIDAFPGKLTDIDISYNQLKNADPRWFAACTNLQFLETAFPSALTTEIQGHNLD